MLLVDTSVWSDHLRRRDAAAAHRLEARAVLARPFVIGEIACGLFARRIETLELSPPLPTNCVARREPACTGATSLEPPSSS